MCTLLIYNIDREGYFGTSTLPFTRKTVCFTDEINESLKRVEERRDGENDKHGFVKNCRISMILLSSLTLLKLIWGCDFQFNLKNKVS